MPAQQPQSRPTPPRVTLGTTVNNDASFLSTANSGSLIIKMTSADCSPGQGGKRFYVSNTYLVYGHNGDRTPAHQALVIGPHQKPLRNLKDLQALDGKVCKLSFQRKEDGRWSVSIGVALAKQAAQPPMKAPPANDSSVFPPLPASQSQNNVTDRQRGGGAKPDLRTHTSIQAAQGRRPSSVPPKPATPPIPATDSTVLGKVSPSLSRLPPQQSLKSTPASAHTIPASGLHKPGSSSTPSVPASVPLASRGPSPAPSNVMVQRSSTAPTTAPPFDQYTPGLWDPFHQFRKKNLSGVSSKGQEPAFGLGLGGAYLPSDLLKSRSPSPRPGTRPTSASGFSRSGFGDAALPSNPLQTPSPGPPYRQSQVGPPPGFSHLATRRTTQF